MTTEEHKQGKRYFYPEPERQHSNAAEVRTSTGHYPAVWMACATCSRTVERSKEEECGLLRQKELEWNASSTTYQKNDLGRAA